MRLHLTDFLASFFPAVHDSIDWSAPLEWCDKELSQVLGQAGSRNKRVDVLAKVSLRSGQPQWHPADVRDGQRRFAAALAEPVAPGSLTTRECIANVQDLPVD